MAFEVNTALLVPDPRGALYWPDERMLIVADLHFEKGSAFAERGVLLPPYDTRTTLRLLRAACDHWQPETVLALGDSFHDQGAGERLSDFERRAIRQLTSRHDWVWLIGNHDPDPPKDLGGRIAPELVQGPLRFRHDPEALPVVGEVAGHLHPCAKVQVTGRRLRRRCFVTDGRRLILPAFGAYTGGLNILDPVYQPLFVDGFTPWVLGKDRAYPVPQDSLVPD